MPERKITNELKLKNIKYLIYGDGESKRSSLEDGVSYTPVFSVEKGSIKDEDFLKWHFGEELMEGYSEVADDFYTDLMGREQNSKDPEKGGSVTFLDKCVKAFKTWDASNRTLVMIEDVIRTNERCFNDITVGNLRNSLEKYIRKIADAEEGEAVYPLPKEELRDLLGYCEGCLKAYDQTKDSIYPVRALSWLLIGALVRRRIGTYKSNRRTKEGLSKELAVYRKMLDREVGMLPAGPVGSGAPIPHGAERFTNKDNVVPFTLSSANDAQGGTYVPRDDLLRKIGDAYQAQRGGKRTVVLSGMGGCGKSELARAYAASQKDSYEEIFWLTCRDGERAGLTELMEAADTLRGVSDGEIAGFTEDVLIIVDNCNDDDEKLLNSLEFSTGKADILFTTRRDHLGNHEHVIPVESDDPEGFAYAVFEKNYCRRRRRGETRIITEVDFPAIRTICKQVLYNTMIVSMIALRLREYTDISITDCAGRVQQGVGSIKGRIRYSKDQVPRKEEMKDILRFLFSDILRFEFTDAQRELLTVLALSPAAWFERDYVMDLLEGGMEAGDHASDAEDLLDLGWLQGDDRRLSIHPLIAEVMASSDSPVLKSDSGFFEGLLMHFLGMKDDYLRKDSSLINRLLDLAANVSPEIRIPVMLIIGHPGFREAFAEACPDVRAAYFIYVDYHGRRDYMYHDCEKGMSCSILDLSSKDGKDGYVELLKTYSTGTSYSMDLEVSFHSHTVTAIQERVCSQDPYLTSIRFPKGLIMIGMGAFYKCVGLSDTLCLPDSLASIGDEAFMGCSGLTGELRLSDSLTNIGKWAFGGCSGLTGELRLPDALTNIGDLAFYGCSGLTGELRLPDSLTSIGVAAFSGCSGLTGELRLPDSLTSIGDRVFSGCSGISGKLHLPNSLTSIGEGAFSGCSGLSGELRLPDSLTNIGVDAFSGCFGFTGELRLPDSLTSIGNGVFWNCSGLTGELRIPNSLASIGVSAFERCSGFTGELRLPDSLASIGAYAFSGCSGFTGELHFPDSLVSIESEAFSGCSGFAGELCLPDSLTRIEDLTFEDCSGLSGELRLPDTLKSIGSAAFCGCSGLTGKLYLPDSLTSIGEMAFSGCSGLTGKLHLPKSLTLIWNQTFNGCSGLSGELRLPDTLKSIGSAAFSGCSGFTGELRLPDSLVSIEAYAFSGCSGFAGELHFPDSLVSIGSAAFSDCSGFTGELCLPDSLTHIENLTFKGCSGFTGELRLPDSLTSIGIAAFLGCSGFTGELHLPDSLTSIGGWAFKSCSGLAGGLHLPDALTSIGAYAFEGCSGLSINIHHPRSLLRIGKNAFKDCISHSGNLQSSDSFAVPGDSTLYKYVSSYGELILPDYITSIDDHAFEHSRRVISGELLLPSSLNRIGIRAFFGCSGLTGGLHLPDSLTCIGVEAFLGCSGLSGDLYLPDSLTCIGDGAFKGCSGLTGELHLPESLTSIGDGTFSDCSGLTGELRLPDSLTCIGDGAFFGCSGLSGALRLPDSLTSIGGGAFKSCSGLTGELRLPDSLTSIGDNVFSGCSGLTGELRLPDALNSIGTHAFYKCTGIRGKLHLSANLKYIGPYAFAGCTAIKKISFYNRNTEIHEFLSAYDRPIICGYENSTAEKYARDHDLIFEKLT